MITTLTEDDKNMMEKLQDHRICRDYNIDPNILNIDFNRFGDIKWAEILFLSDMDIKHEEAS